MIDVILKMVLWSFLSICGAALGLGLGGVASSLRPLRSFHWINPFRSGSQDGTTIIGSIDLASLASSSDRRTIEGLIKVEIDAGPCAGMRDLERLFRRFPSLESCRIQLSSDRDSFIQQARIMIDELYERGMWQWYRSRIESNFRVGLTGWRTFILEPGTYRHLAETIEESLVYYFYERFDRNSNGRFKLVVSKDSLKRWEDIRMLRRLARSISGLYLVIEDGLPENLRSIIPLVQHLRIKPGGKMLDFHRNLIRILEPVRLDHLITFDVPLDRMGLTILGPKLGSNQIKTMAIQGGQPLPVEIPFRKLYVYVDDGTDLMPRFEVGAPIGSRKIIHRRLRTE